MRVDERERASVADGVAQSETEPTLHRVRDTTKTVEFLGVLLAHVTTESADSPRWTTFDLYHLTDGSERYVLSITGRSVLYHLHDGTCNTGVPTPVDKLPPDAEPCPRCQPPGYAVDADRGETVDMEEDYHNVAVCRGRDDVELKLKTRHDGSVGTLSRPAVRLLQLAALRDSAFDARSAVERL